MSGTRRGGCRGGMQAGMWHMRVIQMRECAHCDTLSGSALLSAAADASRLREALVMHSSPMMDAPPFMHAFMPVPYCTQVRPQRRSASHHLPVWIRG